MRDVSDLFRVRMQATWTRGIRVLMKILYNQGAPIIGIGLIIASAYAYANFLKGIAPDFPAALLVAAVNALVLTHSRARTFLKEADLVFLLPAEKRMDGYFRYSYAYSAFFQSIQILLTAVACYPLFRAQLGSNADFWLLVLVLIVWKQWNFALYWQRLMASRRMTFGYLAFYVANLLLVWLWLSHHWPWLAGALAVLLLVSLLPLPLRRTKTKRGYPWPDLLALEQKALSFYYTLANFFVDIPQVKHQVKRRDWVMALIRRWPGDDVQPYQFLFARTFVRYSEYFGIYIRLTIFIAVILLFVTSYWFAIGIYMLGLFLMGFQLPMLGSERRYPEILRVYPLTAEQKSQGISRLALLLLLAQSVLLILPLLASGLPYVTLLVILLIGVVFSYLLSYQYLPKRYLRNAKTPASLD
jgi:ABC-2 type transport system permease protein